MKRNELHRMVLMVTLAGGEVACVTEDGEIKWQQGLQPGRYDAAQWKAYMADTDHLEVSEEVWVIGDTGNRISKVNFGIKAYETGANPEWQPPKGVEAQLKQLTRTITGLAQQNKSMERRIERQRREHLERERERPQLDEEVTEPATVPVTDETVDVNAVP